MDRSRIRTLLLALEAAALPPTSAARAQDTTPAPRVNRDSVMLQGALGPSYRFTGAEEPALLAAIFRQTLKLGRKDAGSLDPPRMQCLALGRWLSTQDPGAPLLDALAQDTPPARPASACAVNDTTFRYAVTDRATGVRGWLLRITALHNIAADTVIAWTQFYVRPLFAAGWECRMIRHAGQWRAQSCTMRWIS